MNGARWTWLGVGVALLSLQATLRPGLQTDQREAGLVLSSQGQSGMAADAALPVLALGAFRGLAVDYLWLRSISLREQGRHFEARELAEQIGRLQPRLYEVWSFLGYDLAYNVSVAFNDWESRWRWIQSGIALLRDEGIRLNPDAPKLYWMLGRIYHDKIGGQVDDFHMNYKERHALDMMWTLGGFSVDELAGAPSVHQLLQDDPQVRELYTALKSLGMDPVKDLVNIHFARRLNQTLKPQARAAEAWFDTPAWNTLRRSAQAQVLREWYGVDLTEMQKVDAEWGPLDWRSPYAMAIYWAYEGLQVALKRKSIKWEFKFRMALLAGLKNAMRRGRITITPDRRIALGPNLDLIGRIDAKYRENMRLIDERGKTLFEELDDPRRREAWSPEELADMEQLSGFMRNQRSAREDFLGEAIEVLVDYGHDLEAQQLYQLARREYPDQQAFQQPFDEYVLWKLALRFADPELYDTQEGTSQMLEGLFSRAYRALAMGQDDHYRSLLGLARKAAQRWQRFVNAQVRYEKNAQSRLGVDYDLIRTRSLWSTARSLSPVLRERLAARTIPGGDVHAFDHPPPDVAPSLEQQR